MPGDVTREGERLIAEWMSAKHRLDMARQQVTNGEAALANATSSLVKWMLPDDALVGEKICVWDADSLVQVEVTGSAPLAGKVTIRKRGRYLGGQRVG